jgi:nitrogen fixation negative regulator NifL
MKAYVKGILRPGQAQSTQLRFQHKDGSWRYLECVGKYVSDGAGPPHTIVNSRDITDRIKAEQERELLVTAIEHSQESIVITDPGGTIQYVNPAFTSLTGYSHHEALGQNPRILKSGKHPPEFYADMWAQLKVGQKWRGLLINKRKDGSLFEEEASISPVVDASGKIVNFVGVKRDVTDRQKIQRHIQETEEMYRQILDAIPDMVLVKGPKSRLLWANKAFRDYYGMSNEQLMGMIDAPFNDPDYTQQYVKDDAYVFETGKVLDIPSEPVTRHDGTVRDFHTVKSPIFGPEKRVIMTVGISRDITERKRLQERLIQSEKLSAVGQLAAGVAHEVNNPLGVILGFTEALQRRVDQSHPFHEPLESIHRECLRCKTLVQDLLMFSRHRMPGFHEEDPAAMIEGAMSLVEPQVKVKNITLMREFQPDLKKVLMDQHQIQEVIINLCTNAIDAMPSGGLLTIRVMQSATHLIIQVADTGMGISREIQDRVFEPFFTTKEIGRGTGLGLSLAHEIVERHHGKIEFKTAPGRGTEFSVAIPFQPEDKSTFK